jgi:hypothetical protein
VEEVEYPPQPVRIRIDFRSVRVIVTFLRRFFEEAFFAKFFFPIAVLRAGVLQVVPKNLS